MHYADVWKISIFLSIIKTVAHYKLIRNLKAHVVHGDSFYHPSFRLVKEGTKLK